MKIFARFLIGLPVLAWLSGPLGAAPASLTVDPLQSRIEIAVTATGHSFTARLEEFSVNVTADAEAGVVNAVKLDFRFASVRTANAARDRAMQEWQQTEKFPDVTFVLTDFQRADGGHFHARGKLTLHGEARDVALSGSITTDRKIYAVDGAAELDTRDYGLPVIRQLLVLRVDPKVTVRFHLQGLLGPERELKNGR